MESVHSCETLLANKKLIPSDFQISGFLIRLRNNSPHIITIWNIPFNRFVFTTKWGLGPLHASIWLQHDVGVLIRLNFRVKLLARKWRIPKGYSHCVILPPAPINNAGTCQVWQKLPKFRLGSQNSLCRNEYLYMTELFGVSKQDVHMMRSFLSH